MSANTTNTNDLRARRQALGLRIVDVAIGADVSPSAVTLYESGYTPPNGAKRQAVEAFLTEREAAVS